MASATASSGCINLAFVLHAHQPAGNFDAVIEQCYQSSYRPFIEAVLARPNFRINLHFSGCLLEWLADRHPEYLSQLRHLVASHRLEMLGGGFYEPILPALTPYDQQDQLARLSNLHQALFAQKPRGIWLAERVWEPELPSALAQAGVEYTLVDDTHFLLAGWEEDDLLGYFVSEYDGQKVLIAPASGYLRHSIPFLPEQESIDFLLGAATRAPGGLVTVGDDLEKLGSWPRTYRHVYEERWLHRFLDALDRHAGQVQTVRLSDYIDGNSARALAYLPSASYPEMMQWALPFAAAGRLDRARADPAVAAYRDRLAGGPWRSFLAKYREANLLHKTQQDLSQRLQRWRNRHIDGTVATGEPGRPAADLFAEARTHLLTAQCNDAYWHGWFGGLYAPHLRDTVFSHLLAADRALDELEGLLPLRRADLNFDGYEEIELRSPELRAVLVPGDGGCLEELDYRPANANLVNSLQRRPETYHEAIRQRLATNPGNLPGDVATVAGFESCLEYDGYPSSCGRLYVFASERGFHEFQGMTLKACPEWAAGVYTVRSAQPGRVVLESEDSAVRKTYAIERGELSIETELDSHVQGRAAMELVFNLLAPGAPDRYILHRQERSPLEWEGECESPALALVDEWRSVRIDLRAEGARFWWVRPIYSVSQSEAGYERIYQGSRLAAVWPAGARLLQLRIRVGAAS